MRGMGTAREIDSRFDFLFSPVSEREEMFFLRLCLIRNKGGVKGFQF